MASTLCCTAEQGARPDSPALPNARMSGATPAKQPLLPRLPESPNSHLTSFRSDELDELHRIFDHAQDDADEHVTPWRTPRARFSRASIYSLHSLHRMTSMRSMIKRKFSQDPRRIDPASKIHIMVAQDVVATSDQDTVVRAPRNKGKQRLKITKDNLRKDLLSTKRSEEGGYDSDARMLDDLERNVGKRISSKRASIHSVNWSPSAGSKTTQGSSTKSRTDARFDDHGLRPYQIQRPPAVSLATRVGHAFSSPNLRVDVLDRRGRPFRRSQSFTSMNVPQVSPLSVHSPFRLPSLTDHDQNGIPWAQAINESLRISMLPRPPGSERSQTLPPLENVAKPGQHVYQRTGADDRASPKEVPGNAALATVLPVEIRVQQAISVASPRPSASIRGTIQENAQPSKLEPKEDDYEQDDNPRHSVHLYSMRISHHLRSGSLLSWEQLADAPEPPQPMPAYRGRSVSDQSRTSQVNKRIYRHERQTSSSGFASSKVPSRWGKVLPMDHDVRDMASSIYSSRPQSPPGSFVESPNNLRRTVSVHSDLNDTSIHTSQTHRSNSCLTDNEDTPRAAPRHGPSNLRTVEGAPNTKALTATSNALARKNSVADTKKSKFREEFSPSPSRKKITPSESIAKFFNIKRLSGRSQSEASLTPRSLNRGGDATCDSLDVPSNRQRRQSQSTISLQTEQKALGKSPVADHVWDQALKAHQEEKACLFLLKNRDLAVHASPFRERSGSIMTRYSANANSVPATPDPLGAQDSFGNLFSPSYSPSPVPKAYLPKEPPRPQLVSRRSAMANTGVGDLDREVSVIFEKQGDSHNIVGAWGRYPSHTRNERTNSAGKTDRVESRDFALEAAIKFASAQDIDEEMIDPTDRVPSMPLLPGEEKKKKVGSGRMAASSSMNFGKKFLKNYSSVFKSSSIEFRKHGRNHRSSITTGGVLEFPELELLPEIGKRRSSVPGLSHLREHSASLRRISDGPSSDKIQTDDSMATLRPRRNSSAPNLNEVTYDGANDDRLLKENAHVWSVYYDDCVPSYPRASIDRELTPGIEDFGLTRFSFDSRRPSMRSRTMPGRLARHSRNNSRMSYTSVVSRASLRPTSKCRGDDDDLVEKRSMVSLRHSTMDLISKFKEKEIIEHSKVLSMTRTGSCCGSQTLAAL
ncbi:hypothetical protein SVAN01_06334 [Stagonosporopsis vannaccii]|nr:hypothetical protein SVAN01_06334 [Stagonosporopsis vannaccii]